MRDEAKANEHFVFDLFVIASDLKWALKYLHIQGTFSESSFFCITFPASLMRLSSRESWFFFKEIQENVQTTNGKSFRDSNYLM